MIIKTYVVFFQNYYLFYFYLNVLIFNPVFASTPNVNFETWLSSYKKNALKKGISQITIDIAFKDVKFLEQVIKYDRKQPEFFEDTVTYVSKRAYSF